MVDNIWESVDTLKKNYQDARKKFKEEGSAALQVVFSKLFEKYPYLNSLEWVQFTPYFAADSAQLVQPKVPR